MTDQMVLSETGALLVFAVLGYLIGAVALMFSAYYRRQLRVYTGPKPKIVEADPGRVTLVGEIQSDETIESMVSCKPCVYMRVAVAKASLLRGLANATGSNRYHTPQGDDALDSTGANPDGDFVHKEVVDRIRLRDESGEIDVDLRKAEFELDVDHVLGTGLLSADEDDAKRVMARFGMSYDMVGGTFRVTESILEPGDQVLIRGQLTIDGTGEMIVHGTRDKQLYVTDAHATVLKKIFKSKKFWSNLFAGAMLLLSTWLLVVALIACQDTPLFKAAPQNDGLSKFNH